MSSLMNISPIDGRYATKCEALRPIFSEFGLIKRRIHIEIGWFITLHQKLPGLIPLDGDSVQILEAIIDGFDLEDAERIKSIERETNHDVKAVEYFLRERLSGHQAFADSMSFIHFACTSEDINNLAYGLMLADTRTHVLMPALQALTADMRNLAETHRSQPMLARTHGQSASPTTVGKEIVNVIYRLERQISALADIAMLGKINGAVGNYNAHLAAYPEVDWPPIARAFVEDLGLVWNPLTTQIEPHDYVAELFGVLGRCNTILLDFCRDVWGYIALGYFRQRTVGAEIGSSTMPHKVNPIDFENAEGNLGIANALIDHLSRKLPVSRWQRDLSDSTSLRNIGTACAHMLLAYDSCQRGLGKLDIDKQRLETELDDSWVVLAEAIQTVMRRYGITDSYEQLKELTRGKSVGRGDVHGFVGELKIPDEAKQRLRELTPRDYTGNATEQFNTWTAERSDTHE